MTAASLTVHELCPSSTRGCTIMVVRAYVGVIDKTGTASRLLTKRWPELTSGNPAGPRFYTGARQFIDLPVHRIDKPNREFSNGTSTEF